ncbi:hypothetical protein AGMMS49940_21190 [Spirochaetia bacterium]|nr:hypothetical protein AGMMS49940_21190 [Spirochaetia bacterium]
MKKKVFFVGFLGMVLALGLAVTGCDLFAKSCQEENDCNHGDYYCGKSNCYASTQGNKCDC